MENKFNTEEILDRIYSWLCESRNRCVEDLHYNRADCTKCTSTEGLLRSKPFREFISSFIIARLIQGEGLKPEQITDKLVNKLTIQYIRNMYD